MKNGAEAIPNTNSELVHLRILLGRFPAPERPKRFNRHHRNDEEQLISVSIKIP